MTGELNTEVIDDPPSCRAAVDWLGRGLAGVKQIADVVYRERGESESFWQGQAGDACRAKLTEEGQDSDDTERLITEVQTALGAFADQIDAVRKAMDAARQEASAAGLLMTPTAILPPGPAPTPVPEGPVAPDHQQQYDAARQAYRYAMDVFTAKQRAFSDIAATVHRVWASYDEAHNALEKAMLDPLAGVRKLKAYGMFLTGRGLSYVQVTQNEANKLLRLADGKRTQANWMQAIADDPSLPEASRAAAARAASVSVEAAEQTEASAAKMLGPVAKIPQPVRSAVIADSEGWIPDGGTFLKMGKGLLKGVPFVGTTVGVASGVTDHFLTGKSWDEVAVETGAGAVGGAVGGFAGAEAGALIGSVFPGPGTVIGGVVGAVVGNTVGSMSAVQGADQAMGAEG